MTDDMLREIFELQKEFQMIMGANMHSQSFLNMSTFACIVELSEMINETPWKPWKSPSILNRPNALEELADVFHFFINICLALQVTPEELYAAFKGKHAKNRKRQEEGY